MKSAITKASQVVMVQESTKSVSSTAINQSHNTLCATTSWQYPTFFMPLITHDQKHSVAMILTHPFSPWISMTPQSPSRRLSGLPSSSLANIVSSSSARWRNSGCSTDHQAQNFVWNSSTVFTPDTTAWSWNVFGRACEIQSCTAWGRVIAPNFPFEAHFFVCSKSIHFCRSATNSGSGESNWNKSREFFAHSGAFSSIESFAISVEACVTKVVPFVLLEVASSSFVCCFAIYVNVS